VSERDKKEAGALNTAVLSEPRYCDPINQIIHPGHDEELRRGVLIAECVPAGGYFN